MNEMLEHLEGLNERLDTALRKADGDGLRQCLHELADLDIDPTISVSGVTKVPTEPEICSLKIIEQFQSAIRAMSYVVSDSKRKADISIKSQFPKPLTFNGKWNGRSIKMFSKIIHERALARGHIEVARREAFVKKKAPIYPSALVDLLTDEAKRPVTRKVARQEVKLTRK